MAKHLHGDFDYGNRRRRKIMGGSMSGDGPGADGPGAGVPFGESEIVQRGDIMVEFHRNGSLDVYTSGSVKVHPGPANDTSSKATPEIGAVESTGEHKGEIYGGIYSADNKPIWFSAAPKLMDHYAAAAWAEGQGGSLPTRKQGDYLTTLKGKGGAFTEIFNRGGSFPAGYVWLAEPYTNNRNLAWCQRLSDGDQHSNFRDYELPVLCSLR
jgi:hypothetical protein